jgi:hypothetical protein
MKPKFMIRDLLWLVLVVGLGCGWWVSMNQARREQDKLRARINDLEQAEFDLKWERHLRDAIIDELALQRSPGTFSYSLDLSRPHKYRVEWEQRPGSVLGEKWPRNDTPPPDTK